MSEGAASADETPLIDFRGVGKRFMVKTGTTDGMRDRMLDHAALWKLFDYPDWTALEARFAATD